MGHWEYDEVLFKLLHLLLDSRDVSCWHQERPFGKGFGCQTWTDSGTGSDSKGCPPQKEELEDCFDNGPHRLSGPLLVCTWLLLPAEF